MLDHSDAERQAYQLFERFGPRAEALAAQRAVAEKIANHRKAANDWEQIRNLIRERRGPRQG